jgi:SulP family sulfate permease
MNGIAIIIWIDQVKRLFGGGGREALAGPLTTNAIVIILTVALVFLIPVFCKRCMPQFASLLSGTFLAIVIMTAVCWLLQLDIERVTLATGLKSWSDFTTLVSSQVPTYWSIPLICAALPFAFQLAVLGYLDTLMTALVIDKMTGEQTKPNQELCAQGAAHLAVAAVGGIAGAQATIRSVLMVKEGAAFRWAGVLVGIFALVEILIFQDLIKLIPQAVFSGVLIKVGYDVFDWLPFRIFLTSFFSDGKQVPRVYPIELAIIVGTSLVTILLDLNYAVAFFTAAFYVHNWLRPNHRIPDLQEPVETEGFRDEG